MNISIYSNTNGSAFNCFWANLHNDSKYEKCWPVINKDNGALRDEVRIWILLFSLRIAFLSVFFTPLYQVRRMVECPQTCLIPPHTVCACRKTRTCYAVDVVVLMFQDYLFYILYLFGIWILSHFIFRPLIQVVAICPLLKALGPVDVYLCAVDGCFIDSSASVFSNNKQQIINGKVSGCCHKIPKWMENRGKLSLSNCRQAHHWFINFLHF